MNNNSTPSSIQVMHLVNGQTVIARVEEHGEGEDRQVIAVKPMVIFAAPGPGGRLSVSLVPFGSLFGVLPPVQALVLFDHLVMCPLTDAPQALANEYLQATSGIAIATPPGMGQVMPGLNVN